MTTNAQRWNRRFAGVFRASWPLTLSLIIAALLVVAPVLASNAPAVATPGVAPAAAAGTVVAAPPWRDELIARPRPLTVTLGGFPIQVEVANNDYERELGLGERDGLLPDTGMLFVWDSPPAPRHFWMKGMRFCLDIVFLDHGQITGASENACPAAPGAADAEIPRQNSPGVAEYVLEVPAGYLVSHGLSVGAPYTLSVDPHQLGTPVPAPNRG